MLDGLRFRNPLKIDIALVNENLIIEVDGGYHFYKSGHNDENSFRNGQIRDVLKDKYSLDRKINMLRICDMTGITKEMLSNVIRLCRSGRHIYCSYEHYAKESLIHRDLSSINYIQMRCPCDKYSPR